MVVTPEPEEPDPAFNDRCIDLLYKWDTGAVTVRELLQQLGALAEEAAASGRVVNQGRAEHVLGYVHHYLGNYETSARHFDRASRYYTRANNRYRLAAIHLNQGENFRLRGDFRRALVLYRTSLEIVEALGDLPTVSYALTNEGLALIQVGSFEAARDSLQRAYDLSLEWHGKAFRDNVEIAYSIRCEVFLGLAQIALHENDIGGAWAYARQSLENAALAEEPRAEGLAYRMMGDVLTRGTVPPADDGLPRSADECYERALTAFRRLQAQGEIGLTIMAQASSVAARGDRAQAARLYREAIVIFTRLGMTYDAARAADAQMRVI